MKSENFRVLLTILAVGLIVFGAWGVLRLNGTGGDKKPLNLNEIVNYSTDKPDEQPVDESCRDAPVSATQPRVIEIASLGIAACIQKVGKDEDGKVAVPTNINLAGWYVHSVLPGQKGVSIVNGHAQGRKQDGLFKLVKQTQLGLLVRVQLGDGSWRNFQVVSVDEYPGEKVATEQFRKLKDTDRQLTLVTVGNTYDHSTRTFGQHVVVRAKAI